MLQVVGYDRFVGEHAYYQLIELYRALRLYVNCFQPSMKLLVKQREGEKVRCIYAPANEYIPALKITARRQKDLDDCAILLPKTKIWTHKQAQ